MFDLIGQALFGWLIADLLSGIVHWWMDGADPRLPVIGPSVILANQEHHVDPADFLRASLLKRNAALWILVSVISLVWASTLGLSWIWLFATIGAACSGEIHVLAHTPSRAPLWLVWLRSTGLLQSSGQHARHHRAPNKSSFCVISGWLNPLLDGFGFWALADRLRRR